MSYLDPIFTHNIKKDNVRTIFELGSRDIIDAIKLQKYYEATVYAFECNPDCLKECDRNIEGTTNIILVRKAISQVDGPVKFFPFDLQKYNNMGASSMLQIDFSKRDPSDPDFNIPSPQMEISVPGTRLDTFIDTYNIPSIDLLCIDLQGYELSALKSLGNKLNGVRYIITECSIQSTYINGATFEQLLAYLEGYGFRYICSNVYKYLYPDLHVKGFSEFDALFINTNIN
jgi:FkbM family methyltransferase